MSTKHCVFVFAMTVACTPEHYKLSVVRSLQPVDAARPMVVFNQIQGKACGRDAVLGALRDMKRLRDVDGYLEVVIESRGEDEGRCAQTTAFPFRYGTSTDSPGLDPEYKEIPARVIPGRVDQAPPPTIATRCRDVCQRVATLVETQTIQQALVRERCATRCVNEPVFADCVLSSASPQNCLQSGDTP